MNSRLEAAADELIEQLKRLEPPPPRFKNQAEADTAIAAIEGVLDSLEKLVEAALARPH